ncbi:hypothetical protein L342_4203 [Escherichia coli CE516]|nr:hypothetical protein A1WM_04696 [Escherichia coli KTE101]ESS90040.1 hypothetical protein L342_4203 [Escherichia coli CE516]CAD6023655.1 unnamed protein product [Escherichia coli]
MVNSGSKIAVILSAYCVQQLTEMSTVCDKQMSYNSEMKT